MATKGKKYVEARKQYDPKNAYSVEEAVTLLEKVAVTKFVPTVEIAMKTNANPKYNDQNLRATTVLPHGTGKSVKIAVYTTEDNAKDAKAAGADIVGTETLMKEIESWKTDFDVLITTPDMIRELAKVAKVLWPKWLMPSPKAGTVTQNIPAAVEEIKKGRIEFKLDKTGNIHAIVGKLNFGPEKLKDNIEAFIKAVESNKPTGVKGKLIKKIVVSPTMGPGIHIVG